MPTKKKPGRETPRDLPAIPKELIDQFVNGPMSAEAIQDASMAFKKALIERALLGHHLGYPEGAERPEGASKVFSKACTDYPELRNRPKASMCN